MERGELHGKSGSTAASMREVLAQAAERLSRAGVAAPRLDAELMLAEACGLSRAALLARREPPTAYEAGRFALMLARRARREPLAYILGRKEFFSLDFEVDARVLVPRPETETVVETALVRLGARRDARVLDIGTGSGAIAIAIAVNAPEARVVATDVSGEALQVARRNALAHRCASRIKFVEADLFPPGEDLFDLVLSNPPYIENRAIDDLAPEVARFEPRLALEGGADGLDFYLPIAAGVARRLAPGGIVMVEVGAGQAAQVSEIFRRAGLGDVARVRDLAGIERMVSARRG